MGIFTDNSKQWAISTLILLVAFIGMLLWTWDTKNDLRLANDRVAANETTINTLEAAMDNIRLEYYRQDSLSRIERDSLKGQVDLLAKSLKQAEKDRENINKKYANIQKAINGSNDFSTQFGFLQQLLADHDRLYSAQAN